MKKMVLKLWYDNIKSSEKKNNGYHVQCWTNRNQENVLFRGKLCFNSPIIKQDYFCTSQCIFCCFCIKIPLFGWWFHVFLSNLLKFQVSCISIPLCTEKLHLNYFQGLGNSLLSQRCNLRHEEAFHNRQISGLSTFCLALSFILYR